jgi:DMSO/TMAO reductase YedYZ heme-binding membrane subunit
MVQTISEESQVKRMLLLEWKQMRHLAYIQYFIISDKAMFHLRETVNKQTVCAAVAVILLPVWKSSLTHKNYFVHFQRQS